MSWLFSRVLVEAYSADISSVGALSVPLRSNPTPQVYLSSDRMTAFSCLSPFGMTFQHSTDDLGEELLTWYLAGFHARTPVLPGKESELTGREVDYGQRCSGSFAKYDQNLCSWRTPQLSLLVGLDAYLETWPRNGMMRNGVCWEQMPLDSPITAPEYGFLPTPRASMGAHGLCWKRAETGNHRSNLEDYLAYLYVKNGGKRIPGMNIHPCFVSLMMGFPSDWISLKPLETHKYHSWLQLHFVN